LCVEQDFQVYFPQWQEFLNCDDADSDAGMWRRAAAGHHKKAMADYAGYGDGLLYFHWDYTPASLQTNTEAAFWADMLTDYSKLSEVHMVSMLEEAHTLKTKYKALYGRGSKEVIRQNLLSEPKVDVGVEAPLWITYARRCVCIC
jgi:hypothetical protein